MKKVVHITSAHPHDDIRILIKECNSLATNGYDVTLLHANSENFKNDSGVEIIGLNINKKGRFHRFINVVNQVADYAFLLNADLYHLHDPELIRIIPKLKKTGARVIFDAHENLPKQIATKKWIPDSLKNITSYLVVKLLAYYCSKCDGIITVNELLVTTYQDVNPNCIAIHNYPMLHEFEIATTQKVKSNDIIYVGGLMESRGILTILDATAQLNVKLKLAGKFENEEFQKQCKQHSGWDKVNFLGFINRVEIAKEIGSSACGLLLLKPYESYLESTPIKLFEYMASGIPVVASDFPYWRSILKDIDCVYWVDPENVNSIVECINVILKDNISATHKGNIGRKAVFEKFNWEAEQKKLIYYYSSLKL